MDASELRLNRRLREQWYSRGNHRLRTRLEGQTADEYCWSPVPDAWSCGHSSARRPAGVRCLGYAGLRVLDRPKEPFPEIVMADLVLHIHREPMDHRSGVCLLRALSPHAKPATNGATR